MPKLGAKKYPYTKEGYAAYEKAKRKGMKTGGVYSTKKAMPKAKPN
jgi:hypothetical protein